MADTFRCYYDDGTILEQNECPAMSPSGSPLINTEFEIIDNVLSSATCGMACLLLVLGLMYAVSKRSH